MSENPIHVLIVDDDADYVSMVKHYLRSFQNREFDLVWESNPENVLDRVTSNSSFDIILMDYYLPNNDGLDIIRKIRGLNVQTPIVVLTANKDFRVAIEAMKYGVEEYLVKDEAGDTILPRIILNVIERVRLKSQVQAAEKATLLSKKSAEAIQELVVTMCHEFNNPLAAIKISSDILARQKSEPHLQDLVHKLNENITRLEKQILKLRDLNLEKQS